MREAEEDADDDGSLGIIVEEGLEDVEVDEIEVDALYAKVKEHALIEAGRELAARPRMGDGAFRFNTTISFHARILLTILTRSPSLAHINFVSFLLHFSRKR